LPRRELRGTSTDTYFQTGELAASSPVCFSGVTVSFGFPSLLESQSSGITRRKKRYSQGYRDFGRLRPLVRAAGFFFATDFLTLDEDFFDPFLKIWSQPSTNFSVAPVCTV
jgi:hypothetical protein